MTNISEEHLRSALKTGLSGKASAVYIVLLQAEIPLPPKAIILRSKLHRQYVYDGLEELREHGLIVSKGERKRITYAAASPEHLLQTAEKKRIDTLEGVQNLMQLYDHSPAGIVEITRGRNAIIQNEFELLNNAQPGDFLDIVGGAGMHWVELFDDKVKEWEKIRQRKKIKLRYIGSGEDVRHNREKSIIKNESRLIPGIGEIVNITIRPDSVSFNIYEPELLTVRVKNKAAVLSQKALFEILWTAAK